MVQRRATVKEGNPFESGVYTNNQAYQVIYTAQYKFTPPPFACLSRRRRLSARGGVNFTTDRCLASAQSPAATGTTARSLVSALAYGQAETETKT
jgi:hypothetical protein